MNKKCYTTEKAEPSCRNKRPDDYLPKKISSLRCKLGCKAKQEPNFRFYALYDRIYRRDVLETAYKLAKKNKGTPGIDEISFDDIEKSEGGIREFIDNLQKELIEKTYRPLPVKRVYLTKANGKLRPLGIPCIKDRVAQTAAKLILEPIFEADFFDCSHGFRPERRAHGAIGQIKQNMESGRKEVYDADLSSYFDTIDHNLLMKLIEKRVSDRSVLSLIRMWLKAPVCEEKKKSKPKSVKKRSKRREKKKYTAPVKQGCGTPQGGVISPLLANIFLNELDKAFHCRSDSPYYFANARIIRYADDFVIMARYMGGRITEWVEKIVEGELGLSINHEKSKKVKVNEKGVSLDFLGFTMRYDKDLLGRNRKYLNIFPSKKAESAIRDKIRKITLSGHKVTAKEAIEKVNETTRGWKNYFNIGYPRKSFRSLNYFIMCRFKSFLNHRSQRKCKPLKDGESVYAGIRRLGYTAL